MVICRIGIASGSITLGRNTARLSGWRLTQKVAGQSVSGQSCARSVLLSKSRTITSAYSDTGNDADPAIHPPIGRPNDFGLTGQTCRVIGSQAVRSKGHDSCLGNLWLSGLQWS